MQPTQTDTGTLTELEFSKLAGILHRETGIFMPETKRALMQSRLSKRLRALRIATFADYRDRVEREGMNGELAEMISALTTNVTRFFRESQHFDDLQETVLPDLIARARSGGRVRFWSAGCSTGEEPYSLAVLLLDLCPEAPRLDIRILASDIDPKVIAVGEAGSYSLAALDQLPERLQRQFALDPSDPDRRLVPADAKSLIRFRPLNLLHDWPIKGSFDVIFCRNVVIYFDMPTQERLWKRFSDKLVPDGRLYIGHSERIFGDALKTFKIGGASGYIRLASAGATRTAEAGRPQETGT